MLVAKRSGSKRMYLRVIKVDEKVVERTYKGTVLNGCGSCGNKGYSRSLLFVKTNCVRCNGTGSTVLADVSLPDGWKSKVLCRTVNQTIYKTSWTSHKDRSTDLSQADIDFLRDDLTQNIEIIK